ncbi:MAG: type II toxin-antitoxin system PemK/MazF family toxin [candidate division WOR-3 bacterium]|nr:type II toxin-antitoxin system PemK/MazF family toxin [candidate division WOR-3 bacterium]
MSNDSFQWWIFEADLNPVKGSEQRGKRPVLIISREVINQRIPVLTILPITSLKEKRKVYPTEVLLKKDTAGLKKDSIVMAHQIRTISKERLVKRIGFIRDEILRNKIREAVKIQLDL